MSAAVWDRHALVIFCDVCLKEVEKGNLPSTYFNKEGWANIVQGFHDLSGKSFDRSKLKNKWDGMKKDWKLWKELKRGCTGVGWNFAKKTIDASDDWWAEKLEVMPAAKKFKSHGIDPEIEEKMDRLFGGVVATGEHAWAPSMDPSLFPRPSFDNSRTEDFSTPPAHEGGPSGNDDMAEFPAVKRKKSTKKVGYDEYMERIASAVERRSTHRGNASVNEPSQMHMVMDLIELEPEIRDDTELYYFALRYIQNRDVRDIFLHMPPERRVGFLRAAQIREK